MPWLLFGVIGVLLYMASQTATAAASTSAAPAATPTPSPPDNGPSDPIPDVSGGLPPNTQEVSYSPDTPAFVQVADTTDVAVPPTGADLSNLPPDVAQRYAACGYTQQIADCANQEGVPLAIMVAVGYQESRLNADVADGAAGEIGMYQITPTTAGVDLGMDAATLRDPYQNILAGARFLAMKFAQTQSWSTAVARYNGSGPAANAYAAAVLANAGFA
jgi:soluble lytic murein transglycosylase-like protein